MLRSFKSCTLDKCMMFTDQPAVGRKEFQLSQKWDASERIERHETLQSSHVVLLIFYHGHLIPYKVRHLIIMVCCIRQEYVHYCTSITLPVLHLL